MKNVTLKAKGTGYKHCVLVDKVVFHSIMINNSETIIHAYWNWTINKWIEDGGSQVSYFWSDKQCKK